MDLLLANTWVLIVLGGLVIGFLIGITGVGAGSLTTPLLITVAGVPPHVAVGTDLLFAAITKTSAAWRHHSLGNVDWRILMWLALGSLPAAAAVLAWLYLGEPDIQSLAISIKTALAVTLILSAIAIGLQPWLRRHQPTSESASSAAGVRRLPTLVFGCVLGALVALTSVGAGAIGVAVLTGLYPVLIARRVVGTDIVHAVPLTLLAGTGHLGLGNVDVTLLGLLLAGSLPGIALGSRVTRWLPDWLLRICLSLILVYAAYLLFLRS